MRIDELSPKAGSRTKKVRVGRGLGSGIGKTSGKGQKGQNSRSGGGVRPGFEGNQMPLIRILPKRGFTNTFKKQYSIVNVSELNKLPENSVVTAELLKEKRIISKIEKDGLKILSRGEVEKPFVVKANKFSKSAEEKIIKAGGTIERL